MAASGFWDRMANRYEKSPVSDEAAYQKKLEVTQTYFKPDMRVLEFGCGTGSTAIVHAPFVEHIIAIDFSDKMLAFARSKAKAVNIENIDFINSEIEQFEALHQVPEQGFDVIMGHSILHLLKNKQAAIEKVYNMLKPGGVFVSSTPCMGAGFLKFVLPIGHALGLLPLVRFFSVNELVQDINGAGFEIVHQWQPDGGSVVFIVAQKPV